MAKLTQYGRMRRRIKREMEAARAEHNAAKVDRALWQTQYAMVMAQGIQLVHVIKQTVITKKMLAAWKRERKGAVKHDKGKEGMPCKPLLKENADVDTAKIGS